MDEIDIKPVPIKYTLGFYKNPGGEPWEVILAWHKTGWIIRSGEHYLADTDFDIPDYKGREPDFFYKNGVIFRSKEKAIEVFKEGIQKHNWIKVENKKEKKNEG